MNRRELLNSRALGQQVAQTQVNAAKDAAVIALQINEAVSGDLIEASPMLAARFAEIEARLNEVEP